MPRANSSTIISGRAPTRRQHALALLIYIAVSVLLFGRGVLADPRNYYVGSGPDPTQFMWYLVWWPWAILHGVNPIYTHAVWAPTGYNLAWATSIGAPSLAVAPITLALGPVAAYNVLALLAPALTAWAGYLLCIHLTRAWWPSIAGGYVLGFSTYAIGHMAVGHLNLTLYFIPPLLVLLGLKFLDGSLRAPWFVVLFTSALVFQFMTSTEVFATATMCGAIALGLAMFVSAEQRGNLIRLCGWIAASYGACAIVLSPVLYWVFALDLPHAPLFPASRFSTDLLAPIIPGPLTLFAPAGALAIFDRFVSAPLSWASDAYIGLPLLAVTVVFCIARRRQAVGKLVAGFAAIVLVLSLGPVLHVAGRVSLPMPWTLAARLPLINNVLPVRMMSFVLIAVAVAFALWLATAATSNVIKAIAALACIISILPRPLPGWTTRTDMPEFFARGLYRRYLPRDANVLVLPYGCNGRTMLWQAQANMYFRMAGGYQSLTPPDFRRWPILNTLYTGIPVPEDGAQLKAFLAAKRVDAIVVADPAPASPELFAPLGVEPRAVGGVIFYDVRNAALAAPAPQALAQLEASADAAWFSELIAAANAYLGQGGAIDELSPTALRKRGLVPDAQWIDNFEIVRAGWPVGLSNGLWIGPGRDGTVEVGVYGSRAAVKPLIETYGRAALATYYPYPSKFSGRTGDDDATHLLLMSFSADGIRSAAIGSDRARPQNAALRVSAQR